jgi:hypothetical protein
MGLGFKVLGEREFTWGVRVASFGYDVKNKETLRLS